MLYEHGEVGVAAACGDSSDGTRTTARRRRYPCVRVSAVHAERPRDLVAVPARRAEDEARPPFWSRARARPQPSKEVGVMRNCRTDVLATGRSAVAGRDPSIV